MPSKETPSESDKVGKIGKFCIIDSFRVGSYSINVGANRRSVVHTDTGEERCSCKGYGTEECCCSLLDLDGEPCCCSLMITTSGVPQAIIMSSYQLPQLSGQIQTAFWFFRLAPQDKGEINHCMKFAVVRFPPSFYPQNIYLTVFIFTFILTVEISYQYETSEKNIFNYYRHVSRH